LGQGSRESEKEVFTMGTVLRSNAVLLFSATVLISAAFLAYGHPVAGKGWGHAPGSRPYTAFRLNGSLEELHESVSSLADERSEMIGRLMGRFRYEKEPERKIRIAFLLGRYRARQAVVDLSREITLESKKTRRENKELPLWGTYPVAEALARIGCPAIPEMIGNIESSESQQVRELSAWVVKKVYGARLGRKALEFAIEKQTDQHKIANLQDALDSSWIYGAPFEQGHNSSP